MPVEKVKGGYRWGKSGKVYKRRMDAVKQGQAAYAQGYNQYREGGTVKQIPEGNKGLAKLPKKVRNKMGYMKRGGMVKPKVKMNKGGYAKCGASYKG